MVELDAKHVLRLGELRSGTYVQLTVRDTGTGMSRGVSLVASGDVSTGGKGPA